MDNRSNHYIIREKAEIDLEDIYSYTVTRFGEAQAEDYLRGLILAFEGLSSGQKVARSYENVGAGLLCYSYQSHLIFFKKISSSIDILRILHQSMDIKRHL